MTGVQTCALPILIGVSSKKRSPALPNVPAVAESPGLAGFESDLWYGMLAPAKTSPGIIDKLYQETRRMLLLPEVRNRFEPSGTSIVGNSPAEFEKVIKDDFARWGTVIKAAGIKVIGQFKALSSATRAEKFTKDPTYTREKFRAANIAGVPVVVATSAGVPVLHGLELASRGELSKRSRQLTGCESSENTRISRTRLSALASAREGAIINEPRRCRFGYSTGCNCERRHVFIKAPHFDPWDRDTGYRSVPCVALQE